MDKKFIVKDLIESEEIQDSYDDTQYFDAILKCRIYLESWLAEYIFALLYPSPEEANEINNVKVRERFNDMYFQISWLKEHDHINEKDFNNLDKIRLFCDEVLSTIDISKVTDLDKLDLYIESTLYYLQWLKQKILEIIEDSEKQDSL